MHRPRIRFLQVSLETRVRQWVNSSLSDPGGSMLEMSKAHITSGLGLGQHLREGTVFLAFSVLDLTPHFLSLDLGLEDGNDCFIHSSTTY